MIQRVRSIRKKLQRLDNFTVPKQFSSKHVYLLYRFCAGSKKCVSTFQHWGQEADTFKLTVWWSWRSFQLLRTCWMRRSAQPEWCKTIVILCGPSITNCVGFYQMINCLKGRFAQWEISIVSHFIPSQNCDQLYVVNRKKTENQIKI